MERAGISPAQIYAFQQTGIIPVEGLLDRVPAERIQKFHLAVRPLRATAPERRQMQSDVTGLRRVLALLSCPVSPNVARQHAADLRRTRFAETASSWLSH